MWPDRVSNPGPLTYESGALPTALRGPAQPLVQVYLCFCIAPRHEYELACLHVKREVGDINRTCRLEHLKGRNEKVKSSMILRITYF